MEIDAAIDGLGALAQESRLNIFRLLMRAGPQGMAAGDIARKLGIPNNTLSTHLAILSRSKLVASRKQARSVIYSVDLEGTRALLTFLVEDCCGGNAETCAPLLDRALADCCGADCCT
jgi:ArsR family transcriptional regulator, arsenate/arsenite/antimonite-responsive transcriptional repressor